MLSIEDKYVYTTAEDSIITKDWAAGSCEHTESAEFIIKYCNGTYFGAYESLKYPPALWKILDEPIVNAIDHFVRCINTPSPVTVIKIDIESDGRIRIYNNGPGIDIAPHPVASKALGRPLLVPTFVFGVLFQGSNKVRAPDSIIGGTNGLGVKLSNCFAKDFILETVDATRGLYFIQRWENHKKIENDPVVVNLATANKLSPERTQPHTLISFLPDYVGLFGYSAFDKNVLDMLINLVRTRMFFAAAYIGYTITRTQSK